MMKILVTGATGFIGKRLIPEIAKKYKIACFVRLTSQVNELKKQKASLLFGDMLDKKSLLNALDNIDVVVHLATSHQQGNESLNFKGSKNLVEACKEKGIKRIIFISSMAAKRKILDNYGKIKLEIEKMIKNSGIAYTILRPSIIYSEDNLSLIGKSLKALPLIIPVIGNGEYKINPVHIKDVVKAIAKSIESKKARNKSYDIAGQKSLRFNEIIELCKKRFGIKKLVIHLPVAICLIIFRFFPIVSLEAVKGINENTRADITLLKKDLNINPIEFEEGIKNVNI